MIRKIVDELADSNDDSPFRYTNHNMSIVFLAGGGDNLAGLEKLFPAHSNDKVEWPKGH